MVRRTFLKVLLAIVVAVFGLVSLAGNLYAQGRSDEAFDRVVAVQGKYAGGLLAQEGVEGTGVGLDQNGDFIIKVYTATAGVPGVPENLEDIRVQIVVSGRFVARGYTARYNRPTPIGVSTGHPDITAGTIGCRVQDSDGYIYALSNNHVYANSNDASIGDSALQPGPSDGGQDTDFYRIGTLFDYEPILFNGSDNTIDAAIAEVIWDGSTPRVGTDTIDYGTPSSTTVWDSDGVTRESIFGLAVQKSGRTTEGTTGTVDAVNAIVDVCYKARGPFRCVKLARFIDQIIITPGSFSAGGDSGSLIVTHDAGKYPVGLLFAGSDEYTIANPIDLVLARFNVTVDDGTLLPMPPDPGSNLPPTADFTYNTTDLTVTFTDQSFDSDGTIVSWSWDFGDGVGTSTLQNPTYTYNTAGTYTVTLTATDDDSATDSTSQDVTVSSGGTSGISLTATGYKVRGRQNADLIWSGATSTNVDIYRDGGHIDTIANDGFYTDNINNRGGGSYTYQVCEAGTSTCSNEATVTF